MLYNLVGFEDSGDEDDMFSVVDDMSVCGGAVEPWEPVEPVEPVGDIAAEPACRRYPYLNDADPSDCGFLERVINAKTGDGAKDLRAIVTSHFADHTGARVEGIFKFIELAHITGIVAPDKLSRSSLQQLKQMIFQLWRERYITAPMRDIEEYHKSACRHAVEEAQSAYCTRHLQDAITNSEAMIANCDRTLSSAGVDADASWLQIVATLRDDELRRVGQCQELVRHSDMAWDEAKAKIVGASERDATEALAGYAIRGRKFDDCIAVSRMRSEHATSKKRRRACTPEPVEVHMARHLQQVAGGCTELRRLLSIWERKQQECQEHLDDLARAGRRPE